MSQPSINNIIAYNCRKYHIELWHFILPSLHEIPFLRLCDVVDRTRLFLVVLARTILYAILGIYYKKYYGIYLVSMLILIISIISLVFIILFRQYVQKPEEQIINKQDYIHYPIKMVIPVKKTKAEIELENIIDVERREKDNLLNQIKIREKTVQDNHFYLFPLVE
jgi:hypothetical protein